MYIRMNMYVCVREYILYIYIIHTVLLFLHTPRGRRGRGGTEPLIFNLGTDRGEWPPSRSEDVPSHSLGGWVWVHRRFGRFGEKFLEPDRIRNPNCTARSLVTMPTAIALTPKQHSTRRRLSSPAKWDLNLREKLVKCYSGSIAWYGANNLTHWPVDQKYLESSEMWCRRRLEKISCTDHVRRKKCFKNKKWRNILHTVKRRKANWIVHILCTNCRLKHVTEGETEGTIKVMGRRGRRR